MLQVQGAVMQGGAAVAVVAMEVAEVRVEETMATALHYHRPF
jgi:hypothetical protein